MNKTEIRAYLLHEYEEAKRKYDPYPDHDDIIHGRYMMLRQICERLGYGVQIKAIDDKLWQETREA